MAFPKGTKFSPEHKAKIAASLRGRAKSPEHRAALSAAQAHRQPASAETRAKISAFWKGRKQTSEHVASRMASKARTNAARPPVGTPHTAEWKAMMSARLRGRQITWRDKIAATLTGKPSYARTSAHRSAMSDALKGKPKTWTPETRAANLALCLRNIAAQGKRRSPTKIERIVSSVLEDLGVAVEAQVPFGRYVLDFKLVGAPLVIECDGSYWHARPGAAEKDARRDAYLMSEGYAVLRLPEPVIKSGAAVGIIQAAVAIARAS